VRQDPCAGAAPAALGAQVPDDPVTLHAWQSPHVELVQQTPSTQLPVAHALPFAPHDAPAGRTGTQLPPLQ
jgi:hypothetical protein